MSYRLVIFDMDGTILNTLDDLADSLNFALRKSALPERSRDEVRSFVGNGIRKLIERSVPEETSPETQEQVFADFTEHYRKHCMDKTRPYDGITDLLRALKERNIKTAVISNKADYAVQKLSEHFFEGVFDSVAGEKPGVRKKPAPDSVNVVLEQLKIDRTDAVYIGDSDVDIQTAANAGVDCILVSWGFRDKDFLYQHGAKTVVSVPEEIARVV
ncbi:MAG: HAD family hydrolase [Lachnospiraceae bacterium]|nr:HAD family hydrolase [Lachnospiraceae bacterium]